MNWYNYVHGDPVNGSDASGLCYTDSNGREQCDDTVVVVHGCNRACQEAREHSKAYVSNSYWKGYGYVPQATAEDNRKKAEFDHYLKTNVDPMMERGLLVYTGTIVGSGVVIGTCLEGGCAVIGRLLFRAKAPVGNAMPFKELYAKYGLNASKLQSLFKWERGGAAAQEAVAGIGARYVQALKAQGVTQQLILDIRASYNAALAAGEGVGTAGVRLRLMTEILKYW